MPISSTDRIYSLIVVAALGHMALTTGPALAECSSASPASGETVICDVAAPNPETAAILASAATDVTVLFLPGARLQTATSSAIELGGGAYIELVEGSLVADIDPSLVSGPVQSMIAGDFTGVANQSELVGVFAIVRSSGPIQATPTAATIELGEEDLGAISTAGGEITSLVTITKAQLADVAMNAISAVVASGGGGSLVTGTPAPFGLPVVSIVPDPTNINRVTVDGGSILSGGAAGVRTTGLSGLSVLVEEGGTIVSLTEAAPAVALNGSGAFFALLNDGSILTFSDGAAGIDVRGGDMAADIWIAGDSRIHTAGDNAPAIAGPGSNSVFNLVLDGTAADDGVPVIATFGENSEGILVSGDEQSAVTMQIAGATSDLGPGLQTSGNNSTLVDVDLGRSSSLSFASEQSSFGTSGDGSGVIRLSVGAQSDLLIYLNDVELSSQGSDAVLLEVARAGVSIGNLTVFGSRLASEGDGAGGVIFRSSGDSSSDVSVLFGSTVATRGADAAAFLIDEGGDSSVRTVSFSSNSFMTGGDRSGGVLIGGVGNRSAIDATLSDMTVETAGAGATGLYVGGAGADSASSHLIENVAVTTRGPASSAATLLGALEDFSVGNLDLGLSSFMTEGDDSVGILAVPLRRAGGGNSAGVASLDDLLVTTGGDRSAGIILGDVDFVSGGPANVDGMSLTGSIRDTVVETAGVVSDGMTIYGLGDGATGTDQTMSGANLSVTTQGDRSRGMVLETGLTNAADSGSTTLLGGVDIATTGAGAHGLVLGAGLGTDDTGANTTNTLRVEDLSVSTSGDGAHALVIGEGATVTVQPPWLGGPLPDGTSVNGLFDSFDGLNATGAGAYTILNQGTLAGGFSLDGSVGMDGGRLALSILGSNSFDQLLLSGSFDVLNPFDLFLDFGSFVPEAGGLFELVVASSQATTFDPLDAISLSFGGISPTDGLFDLRFNDGVLALAVNGQAPPPDIAPIPVPAALPMLLSALGFVAILKRRRRYVA